MDQPRTHYQISLTARQAVGIFAALLVALGLAYFFGLMTGLSGRAAAVAPEATPPIGEAALEPPPIETVVPKAPAPYGSRTEIAGALEPPVPVTAEPAAPSVLQPFEDASAEEASKLAEASPGKAPAPASAGGAAERASGGYWVQVASLSSREEAGSLSGRLSRKGYPAQLQAAPGPNGKGKVYRVRLGPYRSEGEAARVADRLTRQERIKGPWVVPEGK